MAYKQNPGRGPMMKTGRNIPTSMCSPVLQIKDAISGKKVPKDAKFGETTKSTNEFGATEFTTPYSKLGTPGGPSVGRDLGPDFKPTAEQTRKANELRKGTKGISGSVKTSVYEGKATGIKPIKSNSELSGEVVQKTFTPKTPEQIQKDEDYIKKRNKTNKKNMRKMKSAKFWGGLSNILPGGKSGFKPGCF